MKGNGNDVIDLDSNDGSLNQDEVNIVEPSTISSYQAQTTPYSRNVSKQGFPATTKNRLLKPDLENYENGALSLGTHRVQKRFPSNNLIPKSGRSQSKGNPIDLPSTRQTLDTNLNGKSIKRLHTKPGSGHHLENDNSWAGQEVEVRVHDVGRAGIRMVQSPKKRNYSVNQSTALHLAPTTIISKPSRLSTTNSNLTSSKSTLDQTSLMNSSFMSHANTTFNSQSIKKNPGAGMRSRDGTLVQPVVAKELRAKARPLETKFDHMIYSYTSKTKPISDTQTFSDIFLGPDFPLTCAKYKDTVIRTDETDGYTVRILNNDDTKITLNIYKKNLDFILVPSTISDVPIVVSKLGFKNAMPEHFKINLDMRTVNVCDFTTKTSQLELTFDGVDTLVKFVYKLQPWFCTFNFSSNGFRPLSTAQNFVSLDKFNEIVQEHKYNTVKNDPSLSSKIYTSFSTSIKPSSHSHKVEPIHEANARRTSLTPKIRLSSLANPSLNHNPRDLENEQFSFPDTDAIIEESLRMPKKLSTSQFLKEEDTNDFITGSLIEAKKLSFSPPSQTEEIVESVKEKSINVTPTLNLSTYKLRDRGIKRKLSTCLATNELMFNFPFSGSNQISVYENDRRLLNPNTFLNDTVIEFYMRYLLSIYQQPTSGQTSNSGSLLKLECDSKLILSPPRPKIHVLSSFLYEVLTKNKDDLASGYNKVRKWTAKVDLFGLDYLLVPINENYHWYLAIIGGLNRLQDYHSAYMKAKSNQLAKSEIEAEFKSDAMEDESTILESMEDRPVIPQAKGRSKAEIDNFLDRFISSASKIPENVTQTSSEVQSRDGTNELSVKPHIASKSPFSKEVYYQEYDEVKKLTSSPLSIEISFLKNKGEKELVNDSFTSGVSFQENKEKVFASPTITSSAECFGYKYLPLSNRLKAPVVNVGCSQDLNLPKLDSSGNDVLSNSLVDKNGAPLSLDEALTLPHFINSDDEKGIFEQSKSTFINLDSDEDNSRSQTKPEIHIPEAIHEAGVKAKTPAKSKPKVNVVGIEPPYITVLDSLGSPQANCVSNLGYYISSQAEDRLGIDKKDLQEWLFPPKYKIKVNEQRNFYDCGIYLLAYFEQFLEVPERFKNQKAYNESFIRKSPPCANLNTGSPGKTIDAAYQRKKLGALMEDLQKEYKIHLSVIDTTKKEKVDEDALPSSPELYPVPTDLPPPS